MTALRITKPGIYRDIIEADYFADPCPTPSLTQSVAKILLDQSPAHARLEHPRLAPPVATDEDEAIEKYVAAQAIGNAAHKFMLGRGREIAVAEFDNFRGKDAKAFRAEQEAAGKLVVLAKHMRCAEQMVEAAGRQLDAAGFKDAFSTPGEIMLAWREGDLWFRSLVDWESRLLDVWDYKTSAMSCAPHLVAERPSDLGWDIQAAMIERGLDILDPENVGRRRFRFVAQENYEPYALTVVEISEADLTMGRKKLAMAIDSWAVCLTHNNWPAYGAVPVRSRPRPWKETQFLEREIEHHERKQAFDPAILAAG